ncbi:MAG: SprT-like domain-containing protein [Candidatus Eisenbacteria bacterium]|nr:SprT-like domain-containing protein [Candidatus Eisenbacteria bacterium]
MRLWGVPGLEERLDIRYSGRLTRSLGRCHPAHGLVRLKRSLADGDPALLREVVCHEVAHAAVFAIHRRRVRPHGKEWGALMRAAGYRARATYRLNAAPVRGGERSPGERAALGEVACSRGEPACSRSRHAPRSGTLRAPTGIRAY